MKKTYYLLLVLAASMFSCRNVPDVRGSEQENVIAPDIRTKENKIINLLPYGGISPEVIKLKPGTIVTWINNSRSIMEIQFKGKQVAMAFKRPVHFSVDDDGAFISDRIPQDSVASLCFVEKGEFNYIAAGVCRNGKGLFSNIKDYQGKIIVE